MDTAAVLDNPTLQLSEASRSLVRRKPEESPDYSLLVQRVRDLAADDYDTDIGERAPTQDEIDGAIRFLARAYRGMSIAIPRGFASANGSGDIRVYWRTDDYRLTLILPADSSRGPSLYVRHGENETLIPDVTPSMLAEQLARPTGA